MLQLIGRTIRADSQTTSNYATGVIDVGSIAVRNAFPRSIYPSNHLSELHAKNEAIPNPIPCKPTTKRAFNFASAAATRVACQLTFTCLQPYKVRQKLGCQGCVNLPRFKGWDHAICRGRAFAKPIQVPLHPSDPPIHRVRAAARTGRARPNHATPAAICCTTMLRTAVKRKT